MSKANTVNHAWRTLWAMSLSLLLSLDAFAAGPTINTATIMQASLPLTSMACMEYRVVGVCFWLVCTWHCKVRSTTKIGHYLPDAVVSAYANSGENPWTEIRPVVNAVAGAGSSLLPSMGTLGGGSATNGETGGADEQATIRYKNVDVVGSPGSVYYGQAEGTCSPDAVAMKPYLVSDADLLAWRVGMPESLYPQSISPLSRNISLGLSQWGSVYPRHGFLEQVHDYKAAAVMAQRAGDIVTRGSQPHVYTRLGDGDGQRERDGQMVWPPGELFETQPKTGKWQMLLPHLEQSCLVFPNVDDTALPSDPNQLRHNPYGDYAWQLWRPYSCCKRPHNAVRFLGSIGSYP